MSQGGQPVIICPVLLLLDGLLVALRRTVTEWDRVGWDARLKSACRDYTLTDDPPPRNAAAAAHR